MVVPLISTSAGTNRTSIYRVEDQGGRASCRGRGCFTQGGAFVAPPCITFRRTLTPAPIQNTHSKYAPWAGDKGLGQNGIPNPAGAGGGSSSLSLAPDAGPPRLSNLEIIPGRRPEGGTRLGSPLPGARSSSKTSARWIASTSTIAPLSSWRSEGAFSTARASEIHDARIAFFSAVVGFGSFATSLGCV